MNSPAPAPAEGPLRPRVELDGAAPDFVASSTHGEIQLSTWNPDRWILFFSHPADFTPVCTTEFIELAKRFDEFERRNVALLANSVDSVYSHIAWARNIEDRFGVQIRFPMIADVDQKVSRTYGMIHETSAATKPVRCVFIIDPDRVVRAMIHYPDSVGRNTEELLRVIDALQTVDREGVVCPANWTPGHDAIVPAPVTAAEAEARVNNRDFQATDWYFARKRVAATQP